MTSFRTLPIAICLALVCPWLIATAAADARISLSYRAPQGCPTEAELVAALGERGGQVRDADDLDDADAADGLQLIVAIEAAADLFSGSFQTRHGAQSSVAREVHGVTCAEVADALVVMSAIALRADQPEVPTDPTSDPTPTVAEEMPAPPTPADESAAPIRTSGDAFGSPFVTTKVIPVEAGTLRFDRLQSLTLMLGGVIGLLPGEVVPRFDLSMTNTSFTTTPDGTSYLMAPVLRGRISMLGPTSHDEADARTKIFGVSVAAGTCIAPTYDSAGFVMLVCSELGFGVMQISTDDADGQRIQDKMVGFGLFGAGVEAQYNVSSLFHLNLKLGIDLATTPITVERDDGSTIFRSASFGRSSTFAGFGVTGYGLLGVGIHF